LVNIIEEVAIEIRAGGYERVALFGTKFVVQSQVFGIPGSG
jgi:aspartate/glutamate racemase